MFKRILVGYDEPAESGGALLTGMHGRTSPEPHILGHG
jgi:hypothetical protein